jgi:two-component system, NtrC family, response regulator HydG
VDVRIISATNKDLKTLMADGRFREDLYYRIGVIPVRLPPLGERREDIPLLLESFIKRIAIRTGKNITGISPRALEQLLKYHWPGNVRELINAVEYAFVLCRRGQIQWEHLPPEIINPAPCVPAGPALDDQDKHNQQRDEIRDALEQTKGRKIEAAELLGISRVTLWKRMKKYGL